MKLWTHCAAATMQAKATQPYGLIEDAALLVDGALLRRMGMPMAIATDCNPGSSPCTSLLLMLNMACTLFQLTPEEALAGVTRPAAQAMGLLDRGTLAAGLRADFVL